MLSFKSAHFLTGEELSARELTALLETAEWMRLNRGLEPVDTLKGKTIALIFDKPSLRTRVSFTVGIQEMGGCAMELLGSQKKSEEPEDAIRVLQGMVHGLMVRTFEHSYLERMAAKARIPIINGLSDSHHPCQALADVLTVKQRLGDLKGRTISYVGDGNNVLHSLLLIAPMLGVNVSYACPNGYLPNADIAKRAQKRAADHGAKIQAFGRPQDAARGAHALYTDVWTSMGQEKENATRVAAFAGYQLNRDLLDLADPKCIILHCLPMVKGQEITEEMVEHPRSAIFQQAENRLHAQKALMHGLFNQKRVGLSNAI